MSGHETKEEHQARYLKALASCLMVGRAGCSGFVFKPVPVDDVECLVIGENETIKVPGCPSGIVKISVDMRVDIFAFSRIIGVACPDYHNQRMQKTALEIFEAAINETISPAPDPFMGLSQRVRNCLAAAGIKTFVDLHQAFDGGRAYALLILPNFGRGCLNEVRRWIEKELEDRIKG